MYSKFTVLHVSIVSITVLLSREDTVYVNVIKIIFELHSICFKPHLN